MNYHQVSTNTIPVPLAAQGNPINFLIFDLDGVITSEQKYWNTARLTVWELITQPNYLGLTHYFGDTLTQPDLVLADDQQTINNAFIYELKRRAINSNWDLTYFVFCLHLAGLLAHFQQRASEQGSPLQGQIDLSNLQQWQTLGQQLQGLTVDSTVSNATIAQFWQETADLKGAEVTDHIAQFYHSHLGLTLPVNSGLWDICYQNFQAWYEDRKGFTLPNDETVLDLVTIKSTLQALQDANQYTLAIATGRPRNEVLEPLRALGLLSYFDPQRLVTYDEVLDAENHLSTDPTPLKLGKPHPFVLLKAIHLDEDPAVFCTDAFQNRDRTNVAYIGDAASDVVAAKRSGCLSIAVLTGFTATQAKTEQVQMFTDLGCDCVIESIQALPQVLGIAPL